MSNYKLSELRSRLDSVCDIENDPHVTTQQKNEWLREAAADTWDRIIKSGISDRFVKSATFSTVSGTLEYDLTSSSIVPDTDFYRIHQVYVDEGSGQFRPLPRIDPVDVQNFRPPTSAVSIKLYYIKSAPSFKTGNVFDDTKTFDVPEGIEEHTILKAAKKVMAKKDDDTRRWDGDIQVLEDRIAAMGNTDWSQPARVVRRRRSQRDGYYYPYNAQITAYVVRGQKLELYYSYPFVP